MVDQIDIPKEDKVYRRIYDSFRGVDYSSGISEVDPRRSPEAVNIYRDYASPSGGGAIQTRPGFTLLGTLTGKIYGMHFLGSTALIHHEDKLGVALGMPDTLEVTDFEITMAEEASVSALYKGKLYIKDSLNYLVYDGVSLQEVKDTATIPITRINASPTGAGGQYYQDVNLLSDYRKNSFRADGVSREYFLDTDSFDESSPEIYVNGERLLDGFTYQCSQGKVIFEVPPAESSFSGGDNVVICYKKTTPGNSGKIIGCRLAEVFDNRLFLSGNDDYPGIVFHSELDDPSYFSDESWYDDGGDGKDVKALIASGDYLTVIKEEKEEGVKVFLHTPLTDHEEGKVYPVIQTRVDAGCLGGGLLYDNQVIYRGLNGIYALAPSGAASRSHCCSYFINPLISRHNEDEISFAVWKGYLAMLSAGEIYLADYRQKSPRQDYWDYEWYYWKDIGLYGQEGFSPGCLLKEYSGRLYFGCENGGICVFTGTSDNTRAIESYWTTPEDIFGQPSRLKNIKKRGAGASIKRVPNSILKIACSTNRQSFEEIYSGITRGFSFAEVDFSSFAFGTGAKGYITFAIKKNNVRHLRLKFYSNTADKPFGLYGAWVEYSLGRHAR